jgi:hypothetical protein
MLLEPVQLTQRSQLQLQLYGASKGVGEVMIIPDFFGLHPGTLPQWVTAISSLGISGFLGTLTVAWWRRGVNLKQIAKEEAVALKELAKTEALRLKELSNEDEADLRDHWFEEVKRCVAEISTLRERANIQDQQYLTLQKESDLRHRESVKNHEQCLKERDELRKKVNRQELELEGLKLQFKTSSADRVIEMTKTNCPSPDVVDAAQRVKKIVKGEKE